MKTTFLTTLAVLLSYFSAQGQSCLPNGISFQYQDEVDHFRTDYPGCKVIEGDVSIGNGFISNLDSLLGLTAINGSLYFGSTSASLDLHGLDSLQFIGQAFWLSNAQFTGFNGLKSLKTIGGDIRIYGSPMLTDLTGLESITSVGGDLVFRQNEKLESFAGLSQLTAIGGKIDISQNIALTHLGGLNNIASVQGISVSDNPVLADLHGLESITMLNGDAIIEGNAALTTLAGLNNLTAVSGNVSVNTNNVLADLSGLNALSSAGELHILNNAALTDMSGLENLAMITGDFEISQNNAMTTLAGLSGLHTVGGKLSVTNLPALLDINGLSSLTTLGGDLTIEQDPLITDVAGLANISSWGQGIYITGNNGLLNLHGLESLDTVPGDMSVSGCFQITDLNALSNLAWVGGNLVIEGLQDLPDINSLQHLTYVGGMIKIGQNYNLASLSGLQNVASIGGLSLVNNQYIKDLAGLASLKNVSGSLIVSNNPALESLTGLGDLRSVGGELQISYNGFGLKNLKPLDSLGIVGGNLFIEFNEGLFTLTGLEHLKSVGGDFLVGGLLYDYTGLQSLTSIGGSVDIIQNGNLSSLHGLDSLHSIGGLLGIVGNNNLHDLQGLEGLTSIGGRLIISNHYQLQSLGGLDNLKEVGGTIEIKGNHALSDCAIAIVCGFLNYEPDSIILQDNYGVCSQPYQLPPYCQRTPVVVSVRIDANGDCLPDVPPVPAAGAAIRLRTPIQGVGLHPTDTLGVAHFLYYNNGPFTLDLPQLSPTTWAVCSGDSIIVSPDIVSDTLRAAFLITPLSQCPDLEVQLGLPSTFRSCLINSELQVTTINGGTVPAEGTKVAVIMPSVFDLVSADPPVTTQQGDTLFFALNTLPPFAHAIVKLTVRTKCDTFLLGQTLCWEAFATADNNCPDMPASTSEIKLSARCVGDSLVRFTLTNVGDAATQSMHRYTIFQNDQPLTASYFTLAAQQTLGVDVPADGATYRMEATKYEDGTLTETAIENCHGLTPGLINAYWLDRGPRNYDFDCRSVVGSFDPNLKSAVPAGVTWQQLLPPNRPLLYTIDFQNTGTDTAYRVELLDFLPDNLDISTFRPVAASHPCTWDIRGGRLDVLFDPVMLPDSNVNEAASHGYFSFSIDQKPDLPDGTYLDNIAGIIFDFNPVIETNLVHHTIGQLTIDVHVDEAQQQAAQWRVLGNPARERATFRAMEYIKGEKRFELFDAEGRLRQQIQFSGQSFDFQRDGLPAGLYFFKIEDEQGRVFSGKIMLS